MARHILKMVTVPTSKRRPATLILVNKYKTLMDIDNFASNYL